MPFDILAFAMAAAAMQQEPYREPTDYAAFDRGVGGWTVVRRPDGCMMFHDRRPGLTSTSIFYRVDNGAPRISVMFSNPTWRVAEGQVRGYNMRFNGAPSAWEDVTVYRFREPDANNRGFYTLAFPAEGIAPLLTDVSHSTGLVLSRAGDREVRVTFPRGSAGVQRLLDCVGTVAASGRPTIPGLSS